MECETEIEESVERFQSCQSLCWGNWSGRNELRLYIRKTSGWEEEYSKLIRKGGVVAR